MGYHGLGLMAGVRALLRAVYVVAASGVVISVAWFTLTFVLWYLILWLLVDRPRTLDEDVFVNRALVISAAMSAVIVATGAWAVIYRQSRDR